MTIHKFKRKERDYIKKNETLLPTSLLLRLGLGSGRIFDMRSRRNMSETFAVLNKEDLETKVSGGIDEPGGHTRFPLEFLPVERATSRLGRYSTTMGLTAVPSAESVKSTIASRRRERWSRRSPLKRGRWLRSSDDEPPQHKQTRANRGES